MSKNPYSEAFDEDYDYGFTFAHEDEIATDTKAYASLQEEIDDLKKRLVSLNKNLLTSS